MKSKLISIGIVMMFFCIFAYPAIAEDIYNTQVQMTDYRIAWGNGIDDDGDGVIDNWGESDVQNGTKVVKENQTTSTTWYEDFTYPGPLEEGVMFDAYIDEIFEIYSNDNVSLSPTQTCYYTDLGWLYENFSNYTTVNNVINVATFYINISPTDAMNGAQEMWYRSPLVWNDEDNDYDEHYLNIYNEDDELVYASPSYEYSEPQPKFVEDGSSLDGQGGERVYYKLNFNFRTQNKYRFEEYVKTEDTNPINSVKLYMARAQDIGDDDNTDTYVFKGTDYARKIPYEASWSMLCTIGIGRAGTESVIFSNSSYGDSGNRPGVYTHKFEGDQSVDDTGSATFIFPLRTTTPLEITVFYRCWSGGDFQNWVSPAADHDYIFENVTGTLIFEMNISDPNASAPNEYQFAFYITDGFSSDEEDAFLYTMYPSVGSTHLVTYDVVDEQDYTVKHFATHIEVANEKAAATTSVDKAGATPDTAEFLVGIGLIIAGLILTALVITSSVGIPLMAAGVTAATASFVTGGLMVAHSFTEDAGLDNFGSWAASGVIRASKGIIEGVNSVAGALWDIVLKIPEMVKDLGSAALHWLGLIFNAVAEIIWLLAFLAVIWIWSKFLEIMGYVTTGNPEAATSSVAKTARTITRTTKKIASPAKKAGKRVSKAAKRTKRWYQR